MSTLRPLRELVDNVSDAFTPSPTSGKEHLLYSFEAHDAGMKPVVVTESEMKSGKKIVHTGDVLFAKLNPRIPRAWLVEGGTSGTSRVCSTEFVVLRAKNPRELEPEYLAWTLLAPQFLEPIQAQVSSSTKSHQRIRPDFLLDQGVPSRPQAEQIRVVWRIKECLSRVEEMQRLREELIAENGLFEASFVNDFLASASVRRATRVALERRVLKRAQYGTSQKADAADGEYPTSANCGDEWLEIR
jgi:type I restriction enzyme S subunit